VADVGLTDEDLLRRVAARDPAALASLYDRYAPLVYGLARRIVRDEDQAEDLVQEVFLRLWNRPEVYDRGRGTFRAWLLSIAHHLAVDVLRRRRREVSYQDKLAGPGTDDPVDTAMGQLEGAAVRSLLGRLPPDQRRVIELAYFEGLTQREIAARLGEPLGTVKTRLRLGIIKLRALYEDGGA
jgi:RNA polymerase sigma-70 factor (ECF subfamily)